MSSKRFYAVIPSSLGACARIRARLFILILLLPGPAAGRLAAKDRVDLLVAGGIVITQDATHRILENGAVAIRGDKIVAVGPSAEIQQRFQAKQTLSSRGKIVLPGLINTHNHAPMTLFRGIADDLALMEWLQKYIFPAETKNVSKEFVEWGTKLACLEMIRSGTTTYADMYYFEDQVAEATANAGMRGVLGETVIQFPVSDNRTPEAALAYTEEFMKRWKGNPLIVPAVAPHAPYTNSETTLKACKALADKYGVPMIIHVSETQDEGKQIRDTYGLTSTQWLEKIGVLGPNVLFCHGVWLSEEDLAIIKRRGATISHNPESNMKLASGTAPVPRMLALGIPVGLGTDGAASNNNLDMFQAMDFTAKLHKLISMDPAALPARQVVDMVTLGGARALGLDKEIGSLEAGKRADIILVNADVAHGLPMYNAYSHLVYALRGSDVTTSIINGRIIMLDGRVLTINEKRVKEKAVEFRGRILASLGNKG